MDDKKPIRPPVHLSHDAQRFWERVTRTRLLEHQDLKLLCSCCEAWDRMQKARLHGMCEVERESRFAFLRTARELGLDRRELPQVESQQPLQLA